MMTVTSDCASKLRVLADGTRLRVVEALLEQPRCVHELMALLDVEQSLLSHHLRVLRDAGLVNGVRRGRAVLYGLAPEAELDSAGIDLGCCRLSFESRPARPARPARDDRTQDADSDPAGDCA